MAPQLGTRGHSTSAAARSLAPQCTRRAAAAARRSPPTAAAAARARDAPLPAPPAGRRVVAPSAQLLRQTTRALHRTLPPRAASGADAARADDDAEAVGLGDLVELELGGFCCAPGGFLVLLTPKGVPLPPVQNLVERLRGAEPAPAAGAAAGAALLALAVTHDASDSDAPNSVAALTLLQLAQAPPIDMGGAVLPYDALASLTGDEEALLGAVIVADAGAAAVPSAAAFTVAAAAESGGGGAGAAASPPRGVRRFEATLLAGGADTPGAFALGDAWLAVALALRCVALRG
jgi:hypothetical protein